MTAVVKKILILVWLLFVVIAFGVGWWQTRQEAAPPRQAGKPPVVLRLAVASNFLPIGQKLALEFTRQTGIPVQVSGASSGALFAQIRQGRPYDVFLSADTGYPDELIKNGMAKSDSALDYAIGQLVFWAPAYDSSALAPASENACLDALKNGRFERIVVANPVTAPYGQASQVVLQKFSLPKARIITAKNVSQAFRTLQSGNAEAGFIARSQWLSLSPEQARGCFWSVPADWHSPLVQRAVLLSASPNPLQGQAFLDFLFSEKTRDLIQAAGYAVE